MTKAEQLLTVREAAALLGMQPSTIRKWVTTRRCPYTKIGGRSVRIPRSWIDQHILKGWRKEISAEESR